MVDKLVSADWVAQHKDDANVRLVGDYVYRDYKSNLRFNEFKNNVFSIAADFRY